jgi:hypothetical protein
VTQQVVNTGAVPGDGTGARGQVPWNAFNTNSTELYSKANFFGVDSGAANAYVVTLASLVPNPAVAPALAAGVIVRFTPTHINTTAATLNFAGTGPVAIQTLSAVALTGGEIQLVPMIFQYSGTAWQIVSSNTQAAIGSILYPQTAAEAAATVTPSNFSYAPSHTGEDVRRFGAVGDGVTDNRAVLNTANSIGVALYIPPGTYLVNSALTLSVPLFFDSGAILKPAAGITITINGAVVAGLWKIFDQSAGGTIAGRVRAAAIYPEWFGALGNGKRGNNGSMTGTAFTDTNASFVNTDVGKSIFIIPPPYSAFPSVQTVIAAFVSSTAVTLNVAPPWSSTASFTATCAGTTLNASAIASGTLLPGQTINTGAAAGTTIIYQLTGTPGGIGTYKVSISQAIGAATPMTAALALTYYYGTDDTLAINAANVLVGSQGLSLGSIANVGTQPSYNLYSINSTLAFTGPSIYLMTQQAVVGGPINTTAHIWAGLQGRATIAMSINNSTTDCCVLGAGSSLTGGVGTTDGAGLENLLFDCCFAGRDGLVLAGFQTPRFKNVEFVNVQRNNISITPSLNSFVQQGMFESFQAKNAGLHCIYVNPAAGSFANEIKWTGCVTGSPSQRQAGGTALYFDAIAGNAVDTWTFEVTKFTNNWNGDPNFQPLPNAIFVAAGASIFGGAGCKLYNCYAEQSGPVLGATAPAIKVSATSTANIKTDGFATFGWGVDISRSGYDGASQFTVNNGASQDVAVIATGQQWSGEIEFYLNDGTNATRDRRQFECAFAVNGVITALGAVSTPAAVTYTITAAAGGGNIHITVNNTGAVPLTMQYIALTKHRIGAVPFVY